MRCEVCGGDDVTAKLHTPKGVFCVDWGCEHVARALIDNGVKDDDWWLETYQSAQVAG